MGHPSKMSMEFILSIALGSSCHDSSSGQERWCAKKNVPLLKWEVIVGTHHVLLWDFNLQDRGEDMQKWDGKSTLTLKTGMCGL